MEKAGEPFGLLDLENLADRNDTIFLSSTAVNLLQSKILSYRCITIVDSGLPSATAANHSQAPLSYRRSGPWGGGTSPDLSLLSTVFFICSYVEAHQIIQSFEGTALPPLRLSAHLLPSPIDDRLELGWQLLLHDVDTPSPPLWLIPRV